jgi:integrase/recombinase XerD
MPWSTRKPSATEIAPDWLKPHSKEFQQKLNDQGYARATMRTYEGSARFLCEEVARRGLRKGELVGRTLSSLHAAALKEMHANKYNQKRYCLERFIDALVDAGVAERPKVKAKAPTPLDRL